MASPIAFSEGLELPDGRKVRVLAYEDGSIRFRVSGTPYAMTECFLAGGTQGSAILKLEPKTAGRPLTDPDDLVATRGLLESLLDEDPCWFDHHGGCQGHGYLSLQPGEVCPQAELKTLLATED